MDDEENILSTDEFKEDYENTLRPKSIDEFIGLTIISSKTTEIKHAIIHDMGLAATILHGKRGYSENDQEVIFCVLNRFQVGKFKSRLLEIDPNVFFITQKVNDTSGGLLRSSQYFGRVH